MKCIGSQAGLGRSSYRSTPAADWWFWTFRVHNIILNPSLWCFNEQGAQIWAHVICSCHCWCLHEQHLLYPLSVDIPGIWKPFSTALIALLLGAVAELLLAALESSLTSAGGFEQPSQGFCSVLPSWTVFRALPKGPFRLSCSTGCCFSQSQGGEWALHRSCTACPAHTQLLFNMRPDRFHFKSAYKCVGNSKGVHVLLVVS